MAEPEPAAAQQISTNIADEMRQSYMYYAMSVIIGRALPDVRDVLKPANRRVLYGMQQMGLVAGRPYRKCAKIVGEVMGNYHPHGDAAIYDTLVRMAQDFNLRALLVDGQANFGSIDGDPPAAKRYTEARLARLGTLMMADIEKETVPSPDVALSVRGVCGWLGRGTTGDEALVAMLRSLPAVGPAARHVGEHCGLAASDRWQIGRAGPIVVAICGRPDWTRLSGHRSSAEAPVDALAAAYRETGVGCLERLQGAFALAIVDDSTGAALLAIDRIGQQPLFYTECGEAVVFSTTADGLRG